MSAIRNSAVAQGIASVTGSTTIYTVPVNNVLILKTTLISNMAGVTDQITLGLSANGPGIYFPVHVVSIANGVVDLWQTWIVLNAGDTIWIAPGTAPVWYWVSGAVLPYVPGQIG